MLKQALQSRDIARAQATAHSLSMLAQFVSPKFLGDTFVLAPIRLVPEIVTTSTKLIEKIPHSLEFSDSGSLEFAQLIPDFQQLHSSLKAAQSYTNAYSKILAIATDKPEQITNLLDTTVTATELVTDVSNSDGKWLLLLQNSDELRATGGFMGSYVILDISDGAVREWVIEDIYDADGQFTGYIQAPPGLSDYLSSNRGVRLPDANWEIDFPNSAEQILQFFALGNRSNIIGVTAINLDFAKHLLEVTGPIDLPDYPVPVTSDTISSVLRSERQAFFPGSIQKKHVLTQLLTQLQLRISQLSTDSLQSLAQVFVADVKQQHIQFYSTDPTVQQLFTQLHMAGSIEVTPQKNPLILIESNVGINKANAFVHRDIVITHAQEKLQVATTFINQNAPLKKLSSMEQSDSSSYSNQANHNGYIQYQRIFVLPEWDLESVRIDGNETAIESEREIELHTGQRLVEYGFLVRVPESTTTTVTMLLQTPYSEVAQYPIQFFPQSGISAENSTVRIEEK